MELKLLDEAGLARLYAQHMRPDFPPTELKPLSAMVRLLATGRYHPLLAVEEGQAVGYAILWLPPAGEGALLEYLGVFEGLRGTGLGARILEALYLRYGGLFCEAEAPGCPAPEEDALRRRRVDFYLRCRFRLLDYQCALFGVRFCCLYRGPEEDDAAVLAVHRSVYASYFSPRHFARYIQLPLAPGQAVHPAPAWLEEGDDPFPPAENLPGKSE